MNKDKRRYIVIWGTTTRKIKEKYYAGVFDDFYISPPDLVPSGKNPSGKHGWANINGNVHIQHSNLDKPGRCSFCSSHAEVLMGIPVYISNINGTYTVEAYVPPEHTGFCSYECTLSVLDGIPDSDRFIIIDAKANLYALYAQDYPGEEVLVKRQPRGMPLPDEVLFSPHMRRFTPSIPLRYIPTGHAFQSN